RSAIASRSASVIVLGAGPGGMARGAVGLGVVGVGIDIPGMSGMASVREGDGRAGGGGMGSPGSVGRGARARRAIGPGRGDGPGPEHDGSQRNQARDPSGAHRPPFRTPDARRPAGRPPAGAPRRRMIYRTDASVQSIAFVTFVTSGRPSR